MELRETGRRHIGPDRAAAGLVIAALALLAVAWVFGNPPRAAPDEPAYLVKALATGQFQVSGRPYTAPLPPYTAPQWRAWIAKASRRYRLPARQLPGDLSACMAFQQETTAACLLSSPPHASRSSGPVPAVTPQGVYPPFLYLPLGLAARFTTTPDRAFCAARLASAGMSLLLLAGATWVAVVGRRSSWPLVGMTLAVTPMVVFLLSTATTNGVEIAAAACFWAGTLRVRLRDAPPAAWGAFGAGGGVMALSRQLDAAWLLAGVALFVALLGPRAAWERVRAGGRWSAYAIGAAGIAGIVSLAWDLMVMPSQHVSLAVARAHLPTVGAASELAHQAVGVFGWADTPIPPAVEHMWLWAVGLLVVMAVAVGTWRQRAALLGTSLAVLAATVAVQALVLAQIGFGMQARYVLAGAVALPLFAAEIMTERAVAGRWRIAARIIVPAGLLLVAVAHWTGFVTNARRNGVGLHSPLPLLARAAWQPPGGTLRWLAVAGVGAACFVAAGLVTATRRPPSPGSSAPPDDGTSEPTQLTSA